VPAAASALQAAMPPRRHHSDEITPFHFCISVASAIREHCSRTALLRLSARQQIQDHF
jgi:hypothetical protein